MGKLKVFDWIHISYDLLDDLRLGSKNNLALAKRLKKQGINCYFFCTLYKNNRHLITKMVKNAHQAKISIGFNICLPVNRIDLKFLMSKKEFMLTEKKLADLSRKKKILRYSSPLSSLFDESKKGEYEGNKGGCTAGIAACAISPEGEVFPCPFFRLSVGNIFKNELADIWLNSKILSVLRNRQKFPGQCGKCEYLSYCGGCRSRAYFMKGNLSADDPMCYKLLLVK